jgi:hypothetical protein
LQQNSSEGNKNTKETFSDRLMAYESWRRFVADGQYRLADVHDFLFSEAARREGGIDLQRWSNFPVVIGDFDGDGRARDAAIIVVDTNRNDSERFGLVIFINITDVANSARPYWVYRNRDLSRTMLGWSRDGLSLREYLEDGTFTLCHIRWNKLHHEYVCN